MTPEHTFYENLYLAEQYVKSVPGDVIECGVWRGGLIASFAHLLGNKRNYYLFDSFEGLPDAKAVDGEAALEWQKDKASANYLDNCKAEVDFSIKAMETTGSKYFIEKGWFDETMPKFKSTSKVALLRLDGDWYDSIMVSLKNLYPLVVKGGLIIIDDYYTWDGCSRAVHDYLSQTNSTDRIRNTAGGVTYIIKSQDN